MNYFVTVAFATFLPLVGFATMAFAQSTASVMQPDDVVISPRDRALIASKMYAAIPMYFAHLQAVPDFELEASYAAFLDAAYQAPGRYEFDLACVEFLARLKNGHSSFSDPWLYETRGKSFGFSADYIENQWVVTASRIPELRVGNVIETLDGQKCEDFFQDKKKYISASNEWAARALFFWERYLFPEQFELVLQGGLKVNIERLEPRPAGSGAVSEESNTTGKWLVENKIAYIKVPSFDDPKFQQDAVVLVNQYKNAAHLIVDLRGNGGGSTPIKLIDALMDRPYRQAGQATPISVAVWKARGGFFDLMRKDPQTPRDDDYGYMEAMKELSTNAMYFQTSLPKKPEKPLFAGEVFVLIDRKVGSAAEDFCIPFKDNRRATFVGETSSASTGQPYFFRFPNGMSFRISSKRDSFPDGSPFEGIGIVPDIVVPTTIAGLRAEKDAVLAKAVEIAGGGKKQ